MFVVVVRRGIMTSLLLMVRHVAERWEDGVVRSMVLNSVDEVRPEVRDAAVLDEEDPRLEGPASLIRAGRIAVLGAPERLAQLEVFQHGIPSTHVQKLFGEAPPSGHRALADVRATARCFFRLRELGVVG